MGIHLQLCLLFLVRLGGALGTTFESLFTPFKNISSEYNITIKENLSLTINNYEGFGENVLYSYRLAKSPEFCFIGEPDLKMLSGKKSSDIAKKDYYKLYLTEHRLLFFFLEEESLNTKAIHKFYLFRLDISNTTTDILRPLYTSENNDTTDFEIPDCLSRINHIEQYKDFILFSNEERVYIYKYFENIHEQSLKSNSNFDFKGSFAIKPGFKKWRILCFITIDCFFTIVENDSLLKFYKLDTILDVNDDFLIQNNSEILKIDVNASIVDFEVSSDTVYILRSDMIQIYRKSKSLFTKSEKFLASNENSHAHALGVSGRSLLVFYQDFSEEYLLISHSEDFSLHRTIRYAPKSKVFQLNKYYLVYDNSEKVSIYFLQRIISNFSSQQNAFSVISEKNSDLFIAQDGLLNGFFPHAADLLIVTLDLGNFELRLKYLTLQEPNLTCYPAKDQKHPFEVTVELRALFCNQFLLKEDNSRNFSFNEMNHNKIPLDPDQESCTYFKTYKVKFQEESSYINTDLVIGLSVGGGILLLIALAITKCLFIVEKRKEKPIEVSNDDLEGATNRNYDPMESSRTNPLSSRRDIYSEREDNLTSARGLFSLNSKREQKPEKNLLKKMKVNEANAKFAKTKSKDQTNKKKDNKKKFVKSKHVEISEN